MALLAQVDQNILFWFQDVLRTPFLNSAVLFFTSLGDAGFLWIGCSICMLFFKRWRNVGAVSLISLLLCFLSGELLLKHLIARPRPIVELKALIPLIPTQDGFSFPSGHTGSSFAASFVYLWGAPARWAKIFFPILAGLMGLSRIYIGVHYPSDVLAGAILGIIWSQVTWQSFHIVQRKRKERLA
ncbi:MAG: phosphatase PAP2 family protein [Oscillospiraceae bacterium]|nr:phosphatase PAP2 family protein [Oscillospiraceae bacterium]